MKKVTNIILLAAIMLTATAMDDNRHDAEERAAAELQRGKQREKQSLERVVNVIVARIRDHKYPAGLPDFSQVSLDKYGSICTTLTDDQRKILTQNSINNTARAEYEDFSLELETFRERLRRLVDLNGDDTVWDRESGSFDSFFKRHCASGNSRLPADRVVFCVGQRNFRVLAARNALLELSDLPSGALCRCLNHPYFRSARGNDIGAAETSDVDYVKYLLAWLNELDLTRKSFEQRNLERVMSRRLHKDEQDFWHICADLLAVGPPPRKIML